MDEASYAIPDGDASDSGANLLNCTREVASKSVTGVGKEV